ncbi:MAG: VOC family protein [Pseudomonadota bacterium]
MKVSVTIDVPDLEAGLAFFAAAFGFAEKARPAPGYCVLARDGAEIALMEKADGSSPAPGSEDVRRYGRHWTPVHLDFHVADFEAALARAISAGAVCERKFEGGAHPPVACCSDPFGHGFCLIGPPPGA